jgi:hypothetical protein
MKSLCFYLKPFFPFLIFAPLSAQKLPKPGLPVPEMIMDNNGSAKYGEIWHASKINDKYREKNATLAMLAVKPHEYFRVSDASTGGRTENKLYRFFVIRGKFLPPETGKYTFSYHGRDGGLWFGQGNDMPGELIVKVADNGRYGRARFAVKSFELEKGEACNLMMIYPQYKGDLSGGARMGYKLERDGNDPVTVDPLPLSQLELATDSVKEQSGETWSEARDGLLLWLDASDIDGDGKTDAVREPYPLSTWVDKAGKDHNAKPLESGDLAQVRFGLKAERPSLGLVGFDGNGSMAFPKIDRVRTLVCVVERGDGCGTHTTFIGNSASSKTWGYHGRYRIRQYGLKQLYEGLQRRDGEEIQFNEGGTFLKQLQITLQVATAEVTADWLGLRKDGAGNRYFIGNYAEIMIYDRPLAEAEILSIEKYLGNKWGIAIKHDGTSSAGRLPWVETTDSVASNKADPISEKKQAPPKMVKGAVILATVTHPIEVIDLKKKKRWPTSELKPGKVISEGFELKVGKGGKVVLLFSNGTVTTLAENTGLVITKFKQEEFSDKSKEPVLGMEPSVSDTLLEFKRGDLVVDVKKLNEKSNLILTNPLGVAGIRGTRFRIMIKENLNETLTQSIIVTEGMVYCRPVKKGVDVEKEFDLNLGEKVSFSSDFTLEELTALKVLKAEKNDIKMTEDITTESRKSTEKFSVNSLVEALKKVNASPKLTPFQRMRQLKKTRRR